MKKHFCLYVLILTLLLSFGACTSDSSSSSSTGGTAAMSQSEMLSDIKAKEKELYAKYSSITNDANKSKAQTVLDSYIQYANSFPDDKEAPAYLFKAAEIERTLKRYGKAIQLYEKIQAKYPSFEKTPHSLFLLGFTYEEDLKSSDKAKEAYEAFLQKYPKHELADDVRFSLNNIGKSAEDIIKQFEQATSK